MPSIKYQSTVNAIARAFCSNGRKQEKAMIEVGYTKAYANSYCGKMWENKALKAAIEVIDGAGAEQGERTVQSLDKMYQAGYDVAKTQSNSTGMATNTTGIARLYGMDKDNQVNDDQAREIDASKADQARQLIKLQRDTA